MSRSRKRRQSLHSYVTSAKLAVESQRGPVLAKPVHLTNHVYQAVPYSPPSNASCVARLPLEVNRFAMAHLTWGPFGPAFVVAVKNNQPAETPRPDLCTSFLSDGSEGGFYTPPKQGLATPSGVATEHGNQFISVDHGVTPSAVHWRLLCLCYLLVLHHLYRLFLLFIKLRWITDYVVSTVVTVTLPQ